MARRDDPRDCRRPQREQPWAVQSSWRQAQDEQLQCSPSRRTAPSETRTCACVAYLNSIVARPEYRPHAVGIGGGLNDYKPGSAIGAASTSEMSAARPAKLVVCWRFAPACCAAQSVSRRGLRRTVHRHGRFGPLNQAVPVGKICAYIPQKRSIQFLRRPNSAHQMLMRCRLTIR